MTAGLHFNFKDLPHRRFNPLTGEWILVSPHRTSRPWHGHQETNAPELRPAYDPECYLCPGNKRASGAINPPYPATFVFTNDFPALLHDQPVAHQAPTSFIQSVSLSGTCRVICFSPRHDLSLAEMSPAEILAVVEVWVEQIVELGQRYTWVQIFENKGAIMGCSNPHPHGQVWAGSTVPNEPFKENREQLNYSIQNESILLSDYLEYESKCRERIVAENETWTALVPFWAVWPFEILLVPHRHVRRLPELTATERTDLANMLKSILVKYDNLFASSFPYTMGWHGAPTTTGNFDHWQLHAHFYPPLLRSATIKKFLVGYEMLAEAQRDISPEQAAHKLRRTADVHYRQIGGQQCPQ